MPLSHESVVFDIHDLKVYPMLTDTNEASPTYGTGIDVPGIADLSLDMDLTNTELKGDARIMASKSRFNKFTGSITWGKIDLDVLVAIFGGTVNDAGTTPNQEAEWAVTADDLASLPYFKIMAKLDDTDVGIDAIIVTLYKCQMTGGAFLAASSDNFGQPSIDFSAFSPENDDTPMISIKTQETGETLSGTE